MPPYQFRGLPAYFEETKAEPATVARSQTLLSPLASHVANAASHVQRPQADAAAIAAAEASLTHAEAEAKSLTLAVETAKTIVEEIRAHIQTLRKTMAKDKDKDKDQDQKRDFMGSPVGDLPTEQDPQAQAAAGPLPADAEGAPIDLGVPPESNPNPEVSDIGRLKEGKETYAQTDAENQADPHTQKTATESEDDPNTSARAARDKGKKK